MNCALNEFFTVKFFEWVSYYLERKNLISLYFLCVSNVFLSKNSASIHDKNEIYMITHRNARDVNTGKNYWCKIMLMINTLT